MQSRRAWPQPTLARTLPGVALCLIIALMAQRSLDRHGGGTPWIPLAVLALAGTGFAVLTRHVRPEAAAEEPATAEPPTIALHVVAATLLIGLLGCLNFGDNRFRMPGVVLWSSGLALTLVYLWLISPAPRPGALPHVWREEKRVWVPASALTLLAIVLLGAWFRLHLNGEIPRDMTFVQAEEYFDSLSIARGEYAIFFPRGLGREGLFYYSVALLGRLGGVTRETLHLTSALFGTITLVAVYFLARELQGRTAGLLAALLLAINRWHIVVSRTGFRGVTMPLCTALALHALIRALRTRRPLDFGWAGVALGMGLYSYSSFLFVPVSLAVGLLVYLLARGLRELRPLLPGLVVMVLIAVTIAAPLARYALENPDEYLKRVRYQLDDLEEAKAQSPGTLVYYGRSLLILNYRGDNDAHLNLPYARHMGLASGVLLVLGLAYLLWHWKHGYGVFLPVALFVLILPAATSMLPNETPNSLRMSGVIVPAVVCAAVPIVIVQRVAASRQQAAVSSEQTSAGPPEAGALAGRNGPGPGQGEAGFEVALTVRTGGRRHTWTWEARRVPAMSWILVVTVALLLAYETSEARQYYFRDYVARLPDMATYSLAGAIAEEIKQYGDLRSVYIRPWPYSFDSTVLQMNVGTDKNWNPNVETLAPDQPPLSTLQGTSFWILDCQDEESMATLRGFFPRSAVRSHTFPNGELAFCTLYVER